MNETKTSSSVSQNLDRVSRILLDRWRRGLSFPCCVLLKSHLLSCHLAVHLNLCIRLKCPSLVEACPSELRGCWVTIKTQLHTYTGKHSVTLGLKGKIRLIWSAQTCLHVLSTPLSCLFYALMDRQCCVCNVPFLQGKAPHVFATSSSWHMVSSCWHLHPCPCLGCLGSVTQFRSPDNTPGGYLMQTELVTSLLPVCLDDNRINPALGRRWWVDGLLMRAWTFHLPFLQSG